MSCHRGNAQASLFSNGICINANDPVKGGGGGRTTAQTKNLKPQTEMRKNVTQFVGGTTEIHKYRLTQAQLIKCHFWRVLCGDKHEPKSGLLLGYCHSTFTNY